IVLRRRATLYVVNLLIPSCFLITVDLFSFLLPPKSVDRSAFKMTLILGYTVFLLLMNDLLPVTGNTLPLINVFFSLCLALMVASLLETIFIVNIQCGSAHYGALPEWANLLFLKFLARLVFMHKKPSDPTNDSKLKDKITGEKYSDPVVATLQTEGSLKPSPSLQELRKISQEIISIHQQIDKHFQTEQSEDEWERLAQVIDRLLFLLYIVFLLDWNIEDWDTISDLTDGVVKIVLKRRATVYVVNLLIPSYSLIAVDLLSFLLPPQSVDRSAFKMTLIFGYTVFLLLMNDLLPTIVITNLLCFSGDSDSPPPVPNCLTVLILHYLAPLVFLTKKTADAQNEDINDITTCSLEEGNIKEIRLQELSLESQCNPDEHRLKELRKINENLCSIRLCVKEHFSIRPNAEQWILMALLQASVELLNCSEPTTKSLLNALKEEIFDYSDVRPVISLKTPTNVTLDMTLYGILGVRWQIEGLSWDPDECGTKRISLRREKIWFPDIVILEFMDENRAPETYFLYVTSTGQVLDGKPFHVISSCRLDIYTFPFDYQNCSYTFNSYKLSDEDIRLYFYQSVEQIFQQSLRAITTNGEWELIDMRAEKPVGLFLERGSDSLIIVLRRRPNLYVVNLLIPSSFLLSLDLLSFLLPPKDVDRSAFKMTLILGYTVFLLIMNDLLPSTGSTLPLINVFFSLCLALMVVSLLETIVITKILCGSPDFPSMPNWLRTLVLKFLARLVCMGMSEEKTVENRSKVTFSPNMLTDTPTKDMNNTSLQKIGEKYLEEMEKMSKDILAIRLQVEEHFNKERRMDEWFLFALPCLVNTLECKEGQSGPTYESLQQVIERKSFRPSVNLSSPTITNISFTLYAVLGVNEKAQILTTFLWLRLYWFHDLLMWDPEDCDGITKISLPVKDLWTPDIIVYEFVDDDVSQACPYVYVNHTGHIRYDRMLRLVSACNLQIFNFPFDIQNCTFTFGSYMHTIRDVRVSPALSFNEMTENSKRYLQASGEWELVVILGKVDILKFGIDEWDIITFWVVIKRRPVLYVVNLIIPSSFLMIIDILSFYLPPHSVDRSSFKMTLILGYTVFLLIMNDLLPSTANGTPLIGIYFSVCLALMVLSLLETVLITCVLHHNSMKYRPVPRWVQLLVMRFLARLICYSFPEDPLAKFEENKETNPWVINTKESTSGQQNTNASGAMTLDVPELRQISRDLREMSAYLSILRREDHLQNQWCHVGYILDYLLFRIYLLIITGYALVITVM
ncbi:hypothetical protein DNTS_022351, partial [Danionella cerebrum]